MDRIIDISRYQPSVIRDVKEYKKLAEIESPELLFLWGNTEVVFDNQYIQTADEWGISAREAMLGIYPKDTDTLEERRFVLFSKYNEALPFTYRMLLQQLTVLCGEESFEVNLVPQEYLLTVRVRLKNRKNIEAVRELLERMVPVNMIFSAEPAYNPWEYTNGLRWMDLRPYLWVQVREEEFRNG